jgi:hypothetical protein
MNFKEFKSKVLENAKKANACTNQYKESFKSLPNFDAEIFREITGIEI